MTVAELIKLLKQYPSHYVVWLDTDRLVDNERELLDGASLVPEHDTEDLVIYA